jgi:hypothetical protein
MAVPPQNPQERSEEVYRLLRAGDKSVPKISDLELIAEAQTGARGSGAVVEMMLWRVAFGPTPEARVVIDTTAGEEAQVDYGSGPMALEADSVQLCR